jgi:hypothetical protein
VAQKESVKTVIPSKDAYLRRMIEKQDTFISSIAKEALTETDDKFIEGLVY